MTTPPDTIATVTDVGAGERPGPQVAEPRPPGDDDDEDALHAAAHLLGRGELEHRRAQHGAHHVRRPGDRQAEDGEPQRRARTRTR